MSSSEVTGPEDGASSDDVEGPSVVFHARHSMVENDGNMIAPSFSALAARAVTAHHKKLRYGDIPLRPATEADVRRARVMIEEAEVRARRKRLQLEKGWYRTVTEDAESLRRRLHKNWYVIHPNNKRLLKWEWWVMSCLLFVAVVTPYEVAFLDSTQIGGRIWLFIVNRVVDLTFVIDMVMQCFIMYQKAASPVGAWETDVRKISARYFKSWFFLDLISVIPFDMIGLVTEGRDLTRLRFVRTLRLLRALKKHLQDRSIGYAKVKLTQFFLLMVFTTHWIGCVTFVCSLWGAVAVIQEEGGDDSPNWVNQAEVMKSHGEFEGVFEVYCASIYFSMMTLTSIGYGDISAQNPLEYLIATVLMMIASAVWAYIIGGACGTVASLDRNNVQFQQTMDQLNHMIKDQHLSKPLQERLRSYFRSARKTHRLTQYQRLLASMSRGLQGQVALEVTKIWIDRVWWLRGCSEEFLVHIARELRPSCWPSKELIRFDDQCLCIINRGLAVKAGQFLREGAAWGEDMILDSPELIQAEPAMALTFCEVLFLTRSAVDRALVWHPDQAPIIRRAQIRVAFRRAVMMKTSERRESFRRATRNQFEEKVRGKQRSFQERLLKAALVYFEKHGEDVGYLDDMSLTRDLAQIWRGDSFCTAGTKTQMRGTQSDIDWKEIEKSLLSITDRVSSLEARLSVPSSNRPDSRPEVSLSEEVKGIVPMDRTSNPYVSENDASSPHDACHSQPEVDVLVDLPGQVPVG